MARILSGRFSATLKWLLELDREDIGVYASGFILVGAVVFSGYGDLLTRVLLFLFGCQTIYKTYRLLKPKKQVHEIELRNKQNSSKLARIKRTEQSRIEKRPKH